MRIPRIGMNPFGFPIRRGCASRFSLVRAGCSRLSATSAAGAAPVALRPGRFAHQVADDLVMFVYQAGIALIGVRGRFRAKNQVFPDVMRQPAQKPGAPVYFR